METRSVERPILLLTAGQTLPEPLWIEKLTRWVRPVVICREINAQTGKLEQAGAHVLLREASAGIGRAVRDGLKSVMDLWPECPGVLLVQGESCFPVSWIETLVQSMTENPDALTLGISPITEDTPGRQKWDRVLAAKCYSLISGKKISDMDPVLRAVPAGMIQRFAEFPGDGEEYFLSMILRACSAGIPVKEVETEAFYAQRKLLSPLQWLSILWTAIRFVLSSLTSFGVDYALFTLLYLLVSRNVTFCTVAARVVSSFVNYWINRKLVFKSQSKGVGTLVKYYLLAAGLLLINVLLVNLLSHVLMIPALVAKPIVEICMYVVSFSVQRDVVFKRKKSEDSSSTTC